MGIDYHHIDVIPKHTWVGHKNRITSMGKLSDGRIVTGSYDCTLKIWNLETYNIDKTLQGHEFYVNCVCVLSDDMIVSGSEDTTIKIWDPLTGLCKFTLSGHLGPILSVNILNNVIMSTGQKDGIKMWNPSTGQCIFSYKGYYDLLNGVSIFSDQTYVVTGRTDGLLLIHDPWNILKTGFDNKYIRQCVCIGALGAHCICFNNDRNRNNYRHRNFNPSQNFIRKELLKKQGIDPDDEYQIGISCVTVVSDDWIIYSDTHDYSLKFWYPWGPDPLSDFLDSNLNELTLKGHLNCITCIKELAPGFIISGSNDGMIKIWNLERGVCIKTLNDHKSTISQILLTQKGTIVSVSHDGTIKIWE